MIPGRALRRFCGAVILCGAAGSAGVAVAGQSVAAATRIEAGAAVYANWCAECHNGRGFAAMALERRYQGAVPAILDQRSDLSESFVRRIVRGGISFMPPFRKTEITDAQLADLAAYLASNPATRGAGSQ